MKVLINRSLSVVLPVILVGLAVACKNAQDSPAPPDLRLPDAPQPPHTAAVRTLFEAHCGQCHLPQTTYEHALPAALDIFTLEDDDFIRKLSDAQLVEGRRRFEEAGLRVNEMAEIEAWLWAEFDWRNARPAWYSKAMRRAPAADAVVTPAEGCLGRGCLH